LAATAVQTFRVFSAGQPLWTKISCPSLPALASQAETLKVCLAPVDLDPAPLACGIVQTLQHPDRARVRVARAYQIVRQHYHRPSITRMTAGVYETVIAARPRSGGNVNCSDCSPGFEADGILDQERSVMKYQYTVVNLINSPSRL
jgi:hypothetical protein